jgi:hypothetical protein
VMTFLRPRGAEVTSLMLITLSSERFAAGILITVSLVVGALPLGWYTKYGIPLGAAQPLYVTKRLRKYIPVYERLCRGICGRAHFMSVFARPQPAYPQHKAPGFRRGPVVPADGLVNSVELVAHQPVGNIPCVVLVAMVFGG